MFTMPLKVQLKLRRMFFFHWFKGSPVTLQSILTGIWKSELDLMTIHITAETFYSKLQVNLMLHLEEKSGDHAQNNVPVHLVDVERVHCTW